MASKRLRNSLDADTAAVSAHKVLVAHFPLAADHQNHITGRVRIDITITSCLYGFLESFLFIFIDLFCYFSCIARPVWAPGSVE